MCINEHSVDSRHVSISSLLNDLTWLELRCDRLRRRGLLLLLLNNTLAHWRSFSAASTENNRASNWSQLVCGQRPLAVGSLCVDNHVGSLWTSSTCRRESPCYSERMFIIRSHIGFDTLKNKRCNRIYTLNSDLWSEGLSSSEVTLRWVGKQSRQNVATQHDVTWTPIRCKTDRHTKCVTQEKHWHFHSTGRPYSLLCAFMKTDQIPGMWSWSFTDPNLKCPASLGESRALAPGRRNHLPPGLPNRNLQRHQSPGDISDDEQWTPIGTE